jgi:hypothetical protein
MDDDQAEGGDGDPATVPLPAAFQRWLDDRQGEEKEQMASRVVVEEI